LEVHRQAAGKPLLFPSDPDIVAVATDEPLDTTLPQLDVNYPEAVAVFIMHYFGFRVQETRLLA
jgi:hypothetical protein